MARPRLPQQQDLLVDVWTISKVREDVERLLEHVVRLQSEAVALAGAYGGKQADLATLAGVSRQRVGQLFDQVDITSVTKSSLEAQVRQVEEWPQDVMTALVQLARPRDADDQEHRELLRRQTAIVYGQAEADRRHDARSKYLASISSAPDAAAQIADAAASARRKVFGHDAT